jgi:anti-anti-sigma regulatory factor
MTVPLDAHAVRPVLALNLELSEGGRGASARVELHDRATGSAAQAGARVARVALRGCIDGPAARRLERALDDLALRDVDRVLIDCAGLRHVDFRELPSLLAALDRFEAHSGMIALCGLSRYLRDLFRLVGGRSRVEFPASAADLRRTASPEPGCECAS